MDIMEKLVELLADHCDMKDKRCIGCEKGLQEAIECKKDRFGKTADHLIANGVTVQEEAKLYWKPVKPGEWNLTCSACDSHLGCKENANFCPECGAKFVYPKAVMPQPPKGE